MVRHSEVRLTQAGERLPYLVAVLIEFTQQGTESGPSK
jgi:hypothetical protein